MSLRNRDSDCEFVINESIKSSINSLKELIVILTGIAITSALTNLFTDLWHSIPTSGTQAASPPDIGESVINFSLQEGQAMGLFLLFFLCVLRFYHGNMMVLDRYYINPKIGEPSPNRYLIYDTLLIIIMNMLLTIMGLSIRYPVFFFFTFILIMAVSVAWLVLQQGWTLTDTATDRAAWAQEMKTQLGWLINNGLCLLVLIVAIAFTVKVAHRQDTPNGVQFGYTVGLVGFSGIVVVCLVNCLIDLISNLEVYFPSTRRKQAAPPRQVR